MLLTLALALPATVVADPRPGEPVTKFAAEASSGREELSSPLIRIAEDGPLLFVDGLNRLSGNYARLNASGMHDWALADDARVALSGHVDWKRAPSAPDLDWGLVSADLMWRQPAAGLVFGLGPTLQRMWIAGERFRDTTGLQADVVRASDAGHWLVFVQLANNRHRGDNRDLDSRVGLLTLQHRIEHPLPLIDGLDLEVGLVRERNTRDFSDLSSRSVFLRAALERKWLGIDWSFGTMLQASHFEASALDDFPARRDRYLALDFAAAYDFGRGDYVKFEANAGNNRANVVFYESRYRQVSVSIGRNW